LSYAVDRQTARQTNKQTDVRERLTHVLPTQTNIVGVHNNGT